MKARIYTYGKLKTYSYHLFPQFYAIDVVDDDSYKVVARWYQFCWFGKSINLNWPTTKSSKTISWDLSNWFI